MPQMAAKGYAPSGGSSVALAGAGRCLVEGADREMHEGYVGMARAATPKRHVGQTARYTAMNCRESQMPRRMRNVPQRTVHDGTRHTCTPPGVLATRWGKGQKAKAVGGWGRKWGKGGAGKGSGRRARSGGVGQKVCKGGAKTCRQ